MNARMRRSKRNFGQNPNNAILNTAYRGQKTVNSHLFDETSSQTRDNSNKRK